MTTPSILAVIKKRHSQGLYTGAGGETYGALSLPILTTTEREKLAEGWSITTGDEKGMYYIRPSCDPYDDSGFDKVYADGTVYHYDAREKLLGIAGPRKRTLLINKHTKL